MPRKPRSERPSNRFTVTLSTDVAAAVRREFTRLSLLDDAGENKRPTLSVASMLSALIEKGLYDESTGRLISQLTALLENLQAVLSALQQSGVSPERLEAFMLESILLQRAALGSDVRKQGDVAAKVRQKLGITFLDGTP